MELSTELRAEGRRYSEEQLAVLPRRSSAMM
jgi:hypothetical protein